MAKPSTTNLVAKLGSRRRRWVAVCLLACTAWQCSVLERHDVEPGKGASIDEDPACGKYRGLKLRTIVDAQGNQEKWWKIPVQLLLSTRNATGQDIVKQLTRGGNDSLVQLTPRFTRRQFVDILSFFWRSAEFHVPLPDGQKDEASYLRNLRDQCNSESSIASKLDRSQGGQFDDFDAIKSKFGGAASDPLKLFCQLTAAGVFKGRKNGSKLTFEPDAELTVGEFATLMSILKGRRRAFSAEGDQAENSGARFYDKATLDFRKQAFCPNWGDAASLQQSLPTTSSSPRSAGKDIGQHWAFADLHATAEYWVGEQSSGFSGLVALHDPCRPDLDRAIQPQEALASMYLGLGELCMRGSFQRNVVAAKANRAERVCQSPTNNFCSGREGQIPEAEKLPDVTDVNLCSGGRAL